MSPERNRDPRAPCREDTAQALRTLGFRVTVSQDQYCGGAIPK